MLSILDRNIDDRDPIDAQLTQLGAAPIRVPGDKPWHARLGLGWAHGASPVALLLIGAALGPGGLRLLTPGILSAVDPAMPVALAALGVHVALHADVTADRRTLHRLAASAIGSLLAGVIVSIGLLWLLAEDIWAPTFHALLIALAAGVCSAMSLPASRDGHSSLRDSSARHRLEVLLPIVLGGLLLAWIREGSLIDASLILGQMTLLPLVVGLAAWLLITHKASEPEQRIFTLASLLLVGGLADYLSLSALFGGLVAGALWRVVPGPVGEAVQRDVGYLRHPLAVFLLLVGGARMTTTADWTLLFAYALLALVGGLAARAAIRRLDRDTAPHVPGRESIAAGVFPVAFALSVTRSAGPQAEVLLGVIVVGTIVLQLLSAFRSPVEARS